MRLECELSYIHLPLDTIRNMLRLLETTKPERSKTMHERIMPWLAEFKQSVERYLNSSPGLPNGRAWKVRVDLLKGKKYGRITLKTWLGDKEPEWGGGAAGFVDLATGDLYKSAGWKGPAKGIRGTVNDAPKPEWNYGVY